MPRSYKGRVLYWGRVFCQTDFCGGWVWAKVRPWWYWLFGRIRLFLLLVWRRYDEQCDRMDIETAWGVSRIAIGLVGPVKVHPMPVGEEADHE